MATNSERPVGHELHHGVEARVDGVDPAQVRLHHLDGGDFLVSYCLRD